MKVASALRVETGAGAIGNPRWIALLAGIDAGSRSITAAAKASGLSYKAAWDAVDAMNNLAGRAVVVASVGGRGGGGASLTPHGRELLATYRAVEAENAQFLRQVNARLARGYRAHMPTLGRLSLRTSARNQWAGSVTRVRRGAVNDEVEIALGGGDRIVAIVTHASVENLGLRKGVEVIALVKASSVLVGAGHSARLQLSARNQLVGRVARIARGAVNSEVVLALRGGNTVAAIITNVAATQLALKPGQRALAIFKASSVILALG